MALVVFLRGVNVGGHRTFRPAALARELGKFDVVNIGAAGTFVVRKPGSRANFVAALTRKLPFDTEIAICNGRELLWLEGKHPFGDAPSGPDVVCFVSVLSKTARVRPAYPIKLPADGSDWLLQVVAADKQFVFGMYRRQMKAIGYLGQIDKLFGVPATTRNWNTMMAIMRILKQESKKG